MFLLNNYEAHLQQHLERHPTVKSFTDIDQDKPLFFHQDLCKHQKQKSTKVP